jgi:UDP-N-acetylmuramate--alanine ligase
VVFESSWSAAAPALAARARPGDLVLTMGAGDVSMIGPEVLAALRAQHERGAEGVPASDLR